MTMKITALQIHQWAFNREAQVGLPILIGRLITESLPLEAIESKNVSSDIGRTGFDGKLITRRNHPYIPEGKSVWEMSVEKRITTKANRDFNSRIHQAESDTVFIFATALNWPSKDKWLADKQNSQWGEVRAYDASDLEQWIETSPATTLWLSEQIGLPQYHIQSPQIFSENWLSATDPAFPPSLILQNRDEVRLRILDFAKQSHSNGSLTVFADTSDEALAFICTALDTTIPFKALVITEKQGIEELLPWHRDFKQPHILLVRTSDLASKIPNEITNRNLLFIAEARGVVPFDSADERYQSLPRVSSFSDLEIPPGETLVLEKRTGGSLSALHRQLNRNLARRTPHWAEPSTGNSNFVWLSFIGGWDERYNADKEIICELSDVVSLDDWREFTHRLLEGEDAPLFRTREDKPQYKLFSRIDAFLTVSPRIGVDEIDHLFKSIKKIYLEDDPNYHPPDDKGPHFHQKRKYSDALRVGIMDGLAILSYYNEKDALECGDVAPKIGKFFDDIFTDDLAWRKLRDLLPKLAEVSPHDFIRHLQITLDNSPEKIADLFTPRGDMILGSDSLHPPLLWALEGIAWIPNKLDLILKLLCRLQQNYESNIEFNSMNRPSESMKSILRSWMPQTSANTDQRIQALRSAYEAYPYEGVKLALALAGQDSTGNSTHMPIWRDDVLTKQAVTHTARLAIITEAINLVVDYLKNKNPNWLEITCQAMNNFTWWGAKKAQEVTDVICTISTDNDEHNRKLSDWAREWIRRCSYYSKDDRDRYKFASMYKELKNHFKPHNLTERYAYLFSNSAKMEFRRDDITDEKIENMLNNAQGRALSEIYEKGNINEIIALLKRAEAPHMVAISLYDNYITKGEFPIDEYIIALLISDLDILAKRLHLSFLFYGTPPSKPMDAESMIAIIKPVLERITDVNKKATLLQAIRIDQPEGRDFIDKQPNDVKRQIFSYQWIAKGCELRPPNRGGVIPLESAWIIDHYLQYRHPRLALHVFDLPEYIPENKRLSLLDAIFVKNFDVGADKDPIPENYYIEWMFESLAKQYTDVDSNTLTHLTELEMKFYNFLSHSEYLKSGSFILRRLVNSPAYFVVLHKYVYKDEEGNIPDLKIPKVNAEVYARAAWNIFYNLNLRYSLHSPWNGEDNTLDAEKLQNWIKKVRQIAKKAKMSKIIDQHIGTGLSHSRLSRDDLRPEYTICEIMKNNASPEMYEGFRLGRFNSRGVVVGDTDNMGFTAADLSIAYSIATDKLRDNYPYMAQIFDELSKSYRREAKHSRYEEERRDMDFR